ncbi:Fcf2 pre-rRNA processing-domain-containing protein [Amylostereum chailletii]|nr:Fcf2 pre-rRNA processing-domain-containing protein [Amylostereum chailletii]
MSDPEKGKGKYVADPSTGSAVSLDKGAVAGASSSRASSSDDASTSDSSASDGTSDSESDSSGSEPSDDDMDPPEELMQKYLNLAKENVRRRRQLEKTPPPQGEDEDEDGIIHLGGVNEKQECVPFHVFTLTSLFACRNLPPLDPGALPPSYITPGPSRQDPPTLVRDLDAEQAETLASQHVAPAPPVPPPELTKSGKPLTKRERKALREKTAGPSWFDLPAPAVADLPRMYREVEALRLRNQLDPKRFYRKEEGESKGIKGLPKHFAIGTIIPTSTPFGTTSGDNLSRVDRKRTLVDELVDDAEARRYAKKKFLDLQGVRGARGRGTLAAKQAKRKPKW